jgi:hypothetical protein
MTSILVPVRSVRFISLRPGESCACARQTKAVTPTTAAIHFVVAIMLFLPRQTPGYDIEVCRHCE